MAGEEDIPAEFDSIKWRFVQSFGDDNSSEDDFVTALEFDHSGDFIAVGDWAGRICIFESQQVQACSSKRTDKANDEWPMQYRFYTEFQSHEPEFDSLRSETISEHINMIKFLPSSNQEQFLLASNEKTVKLWKVHHKRMPVVKRAARVGINNELLLPSCGTAQHLTVATPKRTFAHAHVYNIHSLSPNIDGETFISADSLRINLWSLDVSKDYFTIVDLKPPNLDDLSEVITAAVFSPVSCNELIFSSSKGVNRLCDLRMSSRVENYAATFQASENYGDYTEIVGNISDVCFTQDDQFIVTRDYLTVKMWDKRMLDQPINIFRVHKELEDHIVDLCENECISDRFKCCIDSTGTRILTGSYNNHFIINHVPTNSSIMVAAPDDGPLPPAPLAINPLQPRRMPGDRFFANSKPPVHEMDFSKKVLHVAWHPRLDCIAVAGVNRLITYSGSRISWDEIADL